jgi:hypothetical protein
LKVAIVLIASSLRHQFSSNLKFDTSLSGNTSCYLGFTRQHGVC